MRVRELVLDVWSALSHKRAVGDDIDTAGSRAYRPPMWVGLEHHRRLTAYHVLEAYDRSTARRFRDAMTGEEQTSIREYGDAHALNRTVLAAVLGSTQTLVVPGATPADGQEDAKLAAAQAWYRQWWDDERGPLKQRRTELRAVKLGNGILTLGWDPVANRVRLRDYDPEFYFPVWRDGDEEFPSKVHLAWEIPDPATGIAESIRRITFDLRPADDGVPRTYPWRTGTTLLTCYLTDATFDMQQATGSDVDNLDPSRARYREDDDGPVRDRDLLIDFVPVVNVANTVDDGDGWGEPTVASVAQILDDLSKTDTDLQAGAATAAQPVVFMSGASLGAGSDGQGRIAYEAGMVIEAGDGTATVLDTSRSLDALLKRSDGLLDRLAVNTRVPASVLGRVSPAEVPSGIALALSFGPLSSLVDDSRLPRREKYRLIFRFNRRIALAWDAKDVPISDAPCDMVFGAFLPQDRAAAVAAVRQLLGTAGEPAAISLESAVAMLVAAGLPIDDARAEVALIRRTNYLAAVQLADATADRVAVRSMLDDGKLPDLSGPPPALPTPPPAVPPPGTPPRPADVPPADPGAAQ